MRPEPRPSFTRGHIYPKRSVAILGQSQSPWLGHGRRQGGEKKRVVTPDWQTPSSRKSPASDPHVAVHGRMPIWTEAYIPAAIAPRNPGKPERLTIVRAGRPALDNEVRRPAFGQSPSLPEQCGSGLLRSLGRRLSGNLKGIVDLDPR